MVVIRGPRTVGEERLGQKGKGESNYDPIVTQVDLTSKEARTFDLFPEITTAVE